MPSPQHENKVERLLSQIVSKLNNLEKELADISYVTRANNSELVSIKKHTKKMMY